MKKIIYGTAKLSDNNYGYGVTPKLSQSNINHLNSYIINNKKINSYEIATKYINSIKYSIKIKNKEIHYKISRIPNNKNKIKKYLNKSVDKYLLQSNRKKIDILYLHNDNLNTISNMVLLNTLKNIQKLKKIKYIGVSVYSLKSLKYAIKSKIINVIQIPLNVCDSYLYSKIPNNSKKIIVARSIYLQGTLLNIIKNHPYEKKIENFKKKIKIICKSNELEYFKTITSFAFNLKNIDYVILGSINKDNINKSLNSISKISKKNMKIIYSQSKKFKKWTNPKNW